MTDPFEDDIATVMEVTGLVSVDDRSLVMQALKVRMILCRTPRPRADALTTRVIECPIGRERHQRILQ